MNDAASRYRVFDHQKGVLQRLATALKLSVISTGKVGNAKDEHAKKELITDLNWSIAFVHIHEKQWKELCQAPELSNRVIVRFSTEGFPPTPRVGTSAICLHCVKKIDKLTQNDLERLKTSFVGRTEIELLHKGIVPEGIRDLIRFPSPRLYLLHILLQGVLAAWAADSSGEANRAERARKLLGLKNLPSVTPPSGLDKRHTLWKGLGVETGGTINAFKRDKFREAIALELGGSGADADSVIFTLVDSVLSGGADTSLDADTIFKGFEYLDKVVTR